MGAGFGRYHAFAWLVTNNVHDLNSRLIRTFMHPLLKITDSSSCLSDHFLLRTASKLTCHAEEEVLGAVVTNCIAYIGLCIYGQ